MAQTSLRSIIGKSDLDDLLSNREKLNQGLELMIDSPAVGWGVQIDRVEIKDVSLPETMKRSMARQAEADRERRARVINADAELQASKKLAEAAAADVGAARRAATAAAADGGRRSPPRRTPPWCCPSRWSCCASWSGRLRSGSRTRRPSRWVLWGSRLYGSRPAPPAFGSPAVTSRTARPILTVPVHDVCRAGAETAARREACRVPFLLRKCPFPGCHGSPASLKGRETRRGPRIVRTFEKWSMVGKEK